MENRPINIAVVGCGHLGKFHAEKYSKLPTSNLIAVCDLIEERGKSLAAKFDCLYLQNFKELIKHNIQAVSIASDTSSHYEVAQFLLSHNIDVLIEKPITVTQEEARELIQIAKQNQRIIQVGHVERFNPVLTRAKDYIHTPWFFEVKRIAPFKARGADVDVLLDLMIHDVDLLLYLVNRPIVNIQAVGIPVLTKSIDIANARIEFQGGVVANITASRVAMNSERTFRIFQPNCYISLDLNQRTIRISRKDEVEEGAELPVIHNENLEVDTDDALLSEIKSFLYCVYSREEPLVSGEDGLNALDVVYRIKDSIRVSTKKVQNVTNEFFKNIEI